MSYKCCQYKLTISTRNMFLLAFQLSLSLFCIGLTRGQVEPVSTDTIEKINKFRSLVTGNIYPNESLVHNFVKHDWYIHQWLTKNNLDVDVARKHFMEHLAWRYTQKIDKIHLEDWTRFHEEYPQYVNTQDKIGRPILERWMSDWNFQHAVISGQSQKLVRWMIFLLEMGQRNLYEIRRIPGNQNVTGVLELVDLEGFNSWEHSCVNCIPIYTSFGNLAEKHYPLLSDKVRLVNVGPSFRSFLTVAGDIFSYGTKKITKMYTSKKEWLPVLDREINKEQRSQRFGGTLVRADRTSRE